MGKRNVMLQSEKIKNKLLILLIKYSYKHVLRQCDDIHIYYKSMAYGRAAICLVNEPAL